MVSCKTSDENFIVFIINSNRNAKFFQILPLFLLYLHKNLQKYLLLFVLQFLSQSFCSVSESSAKLLTCGTVSISRKKPFSIGIFLSFWLVFFFGFMVEQLLNLLLFSVRYILLAIQNLSHSSVIF